MSPVAINGVDKQGIHINGLQQKQALSAASETVDKGVYDPTTLSAVDADLAVGNIKSAVTIFGKLGTYVGVDVSDADALVTDVKDPKTFYSVAAPRKTGTMPTVAIVAANSAYPAGYHAGNVGGLEAIDADLAAGNIKLGVNIFGKVGTYEGAAPTVTEALFLNNTDTWPPDLIATYTDLESVNIPATAKKVILILQGKQYSDGVNAYLRATYNGVERIAEFLASGTAYFMYRWAGDGTGGATTAKVQGKYQTAETSLRAYYECLFYYVS